MTASKEQIKMWKKVLNDYANLAPNLVGKELEYNLVRQGHIRDLLEEVGKD